MPPNPERSSLKVQSEASILAAVRLPDSTFDHADPFGELRSLAEQAGARVVGELTQNLPRPVSATYMGSGKLEELKLLCEALDASTVIFDHDLSPKQIANIEGAIGRKVIDRSELILDIFAARATSAEAKLQVELAQLEYTYPRLKAMWSHLERIVGVGGIGGIGTRGPGEQQLEIDRRLVQSRRNDLEREIRVIQARKRREVQARKAEHFTVGLVGYTNAGKSTLFNSLTAGGAYADDRLFATLMTRTREWDLGGGVEVMLSDTVGFVRDLPHNLIAAFRATLEEATHADLLLIVLDVADPAAQLQYETVMGTLDDLFEEIEEESEGDDNGWTPPPRVVLLNKVDRLQDNAPLLIWQQRIPDAIPICALPAKPGPDGQPLPRRGIPELTDLVRRACRGEERELELSLPLSEAKTISTIERRAKVLAREYGPGGVTLKVSIGERQLQQLLASGAKVRIAGHDRAKARPAPGWGPAQPLPKPVTPRVDNALPPADT
ncbi:MAG: GTPase HflX [Phycisphaerales bacterium]|nr:GTPase HflX [Phycisphaerales bacterium]